MMTNNRKGFTLVELLLAIVVIGILSVMFMFSSSEAISTTKAATIVANLQTLQKATTAWYFDNMDKVDPDGRVRLSKNDVRPIQEWGDAQLQISKYIANSGAGTINFNTKSKQTNGTQNTEMNKGCYGVCDGGNGKRTMWYVGYRFRDNEDAVKQKVKGRLKTFEMHFATGDAHKNNDVDADQAAAVWLRVL